MILMRKEKLDQDLEDARAGKTDNKFCNNRLKEFLELDKNVKSQQKPVAHKMSDAISKDMKILFKESEQQKKEEEAKLRIERNRDILQRIKDM